MTMINLGNGKYRPLEEIEEAFEKAKKWASLKEKLSEIDELQDEWEMKDDLRNETHQLLQRIKEILKN